MLAYFPECLPNERFKVLDDVGDYDYVAELIDSLSSESDRGSAIVGVAYIDELFSEILTSFSQNPQKMESLVKNLQGAKNADLCLSLGLISDEERHTYSILASIRNKFAHRKTVAFDDLDVVGYCNSLKFAPLEGSDKMPSRDRFLSNLFVLFMELSDRPKFFKANPSTKIEVRRTVKQKKYPEK